MTIEESVVAYIASEHFQIKSWSNRYSGKWIVIRKRDGKIMTEDPLPYTPLKWVQIWGPMRT